MAFDLKVHKALRLTPQEERQWQADVAALREQDREPYLCQLRFGDRFLKLQDRWGGKVSVLAQEAGVSPYLARQRACIARRIPENSPLRAMAFSFSILRLLSPLPDPGHWAQQARKLQDAGQLTIRNFAQLLEDAGERERRPRKPRTLPCQHCERAIQEDDPAKVYVRVLEGHGWFCSDACAIAHLTEHAALNPTASPEPTDGVESQSKIQSPEAKIDAPPTPEKRDSESPTPSPAASATPESEEEGRIVLFGDVKLTTRSHPT